MKTFWLLPTFFLLAACEAKPVSHRMPVHSVRELMAHPATLKIVTAWCADNPGLRRNNPSCVNARYAELRLMSGNGSAPRLDTSPPK